MTTHLPPPWRRPAALCLGLLMATAVAVVAVAALAIPILGAAAISVLIGSMVSIGLETWDDRYFPDLLITDEAGTA